MRTYRSFTDAYYDQINSLVKEPEYVCSPRGLKIKEKLGVSFEIENPLDRIPQLKFRNYNSSYFIAETLYYLSGRQDTEWIAYYSAFWNQISENGIANSAYGSRIFKSHLSLPDVHNWTQWQYILDELCSDNDSRRAVIHIRSPYDSVYAKKDVPCTLTFQFFIREEKLHMVAQLRSNDVWLGLGNDIPAFTILQELMALDLSERLQRRIDVGRYIHIANSLHLYQKNFEVANEVIESETNKVYVNAELSLEMPSMPYRPPISKLMVYENLIRNSSSDNEIFDIIDKFSTHENKYYIDWILLLAKHRAIKLGDQTLELNLEQMINYKGYCYR